MKVVLKDIGKKYENQEGYTLKGINLEIKSKNFCVILGPSGCGKSTLLRMLAGLNSVTEGDMFFNDKRINRVPSKDRDIAMVFQSYALYPHMSVYDNMAFSLAMRKEPKKLIDQRVKEAAEVLQLTHCLDTKPANISGGQRQRVALGRAMVRKPSVFLMDEPLSNLDAKLREHMRVELVRLHKKLETTTIYVTHDQVEAMTMADQIILMHDGKIQQDGAPDDFYNKPANLFVAQFIGSPSINLVAGKIENGIFIDSNNELKITPEASATSFLKEYEGKEVTIGIRPERFNENKDSNSFSGIVMNVEALGMIKILYVKLPSGKELVITAPGHSKFKVDETYTFSFQVEAIHYFDTITGLRIN